MKRLLAGIDVGTTGLKAALFTKTGERIAYAYRKYSLEYTAPGQAVINPDIWWQSLCSCMRELSEEVPLKDVEAIGVSCSNALVTARETMQTVFPAIMQLDKRGAGTVERIQHDVGAEKVYRITGNRVAAGLYWGPTLKWLAQNEREEFLRIRFVFNPASYLVMRLTGEYCMDHTRATTTMMYDIERGQWNEELCRYFEIPMRNMPRLLGSHEIAGKTRGTMEWGLPEGIPVTAGVMDTISAMMGLSSGGVQDALILGSVGRFCVSAPKRDPRFMNSVSFDRSCQLSITPVNSGGIALQWVKNLIFDESVAPEKAYKKIDELAQSTPAGSDGLLFYPYLNGAASPHWNDALSASFNGLTLCHGRGHFFRSVMEGVGYSLAENLNILEKEDGADVRTLHVGGGGARNEIWMQIISDILGKELVVMTQLETETMGAALLAGMGMGIISPGAVMKNWNSEKYHIAPDGERHAFYQKQLRRFC